MVARAAQSVERGGCDKAVNAEAGRALCLVDDAQGFHVDDARKHGDAAAGDGDSFLQHVIALCVGQEGDLTRGAKEEQAVDACVDHAVDRASQRLEVELTGRHQAG